MKKWIFDFFYRLTRNRQTAIYLFAILFLPGTFIHEMSHFLMALLLLVPVGQINLFPAVEDEGIKLGSVAIGKVDPIRRTIIGIAPIIFGLGIIYFSFVYIHNLIIDIFILFEVGNTMFSSKKDLEAAPIAIAMVILFIIILYLLGVKINLQELQRLLQR